MYSKKYQKLEEAYLNFYEGRGSKPHTPQDAERFAEKLGKRGAREAARNPERAQETIRRYQGGAERLQSISPSGTSAYTAAKRGFQKASRKQHEEVELYDIILSHLLDEGYADTIDSAEIIMDNMSEEWVDDILETNRGDQYATRGMDPQQALAKKTAMRDYRNTSGGHLYAKAATDERTNRHRGAGHAVPGYRGRGQTSRPTPRNTQTNAQMMRTSPDKSMAKDYVRKQLETQRSARKYIEKARKGN